ncbi:uncharacterized protein LOC117188157 [Drosophila miranda]|uniref:uncharacterized protein LOC117188157 n=1 Tax=Drosophila miranda TaxID=7229 RepID=UPI00143FA975|nr:uncharacterized protein LOC117188157 [Drosophila miranda]
MKAKAQYKAALKLLSRLQGKADISQEEKSKLALAEQRVQEGREHYAQLPQMKATNGGFANKVKEMLATQRQRSIESSAKDTSASKRQRGPKEECRRTPAPTFEGAGWLNGVKILKWCPYWKLCGRGPSWRW